MPLVETQRAVAPAWQPARWRRLHAAQQPPWPDRAALRQVVDELAARPALVDPGEVYTLRRTLARVAHAGGFVVQAGDCAETFESSCEDEVAQRVRALHESCRTIADALRLPVVPIGRIAGQYAKPRSAPTEQVDGIELPVFRGVNVNSPEPSRQARIPDPRRLLLGYDHAAAAMRALRELTRHGVAMSGLWGAGAPALWTSHEALVLDYEEPLTRHDPELDAWVLTSTHLPWIGARTGDPEGSHVEFLAGLANPLGLKVGPDLAPDRLAALCRRLDPDRRPGRLLLVSRMGADLVERRLPALVEVVSRAGHPVVWLCDPMHGNTYRTACGLKTRSVEQVVAEITGFFAAVRAGGGWPGGIHLESTPHDVTECVDVRGGPQEAGLAHRYRSVCDPRLNGEQTKRVVEHVARLCLPSMTPPAVPSNHPHHRRRHGARSRTAEIDS